MLRRGGRLFGLFYEPMAPSNPPFTTSEGELPRHRLFRGIGHLVLRDGWGPDSTWIQLACGPYFAKHDHLDAAHLVVYRKGQLAIDSGADYTDTESPHYLNYYRRSVAHNTLLVYEPGESFFWSETEVVDKLFRILETAYMQTLQMSRKQKISMRQAALALGIKRVHEAKRLRGLFP